jgi:hypothetical protein
MQSEFSGANKQSKARLKTSINPKDVVEGVQTIVSYIEALTEASNHSSTRHHNNPERTTSRTRLPRYVYNKEILTNISYNTNSVNTAEKGQSLSTIGEGLLKLPGLNLPNVNICPSMSMNLISVSSICELSYSVTFTKPGCTVNQNNIIILTAERTGGLYAFRV